jgi:Zn-dependent protease
LDVLGVRFSRREVRDLGAAWLALSVAFAILFAGGGLEIGNLVADDPLRAAGLVVVSLFTAGLGFMIHELAHKLVAVRFGQVAEFRAEYGMLFVAVVSALAGFIFAAPGAVHHAGRITERERGLVALAGPLSNVALAGPFAAVLVGGIVLDSGLVAQVGLYGVAINALLAGFNMLPFGPLDGKSVLEWSTAWYVATAVPMLLVGSTAIFFLI